MDWFKIRLKGYSSTNYHSTRGNKSRRFPENAYYIGYKDSKKILE